MYPAFIFCRERSPQQNGKKVLGCEGSRWVFILVQCLNFLRNTIHAWELFQLQAEVEPRTSSIGRQDQSLILFLLCFVFAPAILMSKVNQVGRKNAGSSAHQYIGQIMLVVENTHGANGARYSIATDAVPYAFVSVFLL